jgi:HEAT repeat protein
MPRPAEVASKRRAAAVAGHQGDERTAREALGDDSGAVRATALGALARIGALTEADLHRGAVDADRRVRARTAELAATIECARALPILLGLLDDREASVVEAACFALGELGEQLGGVVDEAAAAVGKLCAVARDHREHLCREAAVAALGAIGDPAGLGAILDATSDKPAVRRRAVIALSPFSGPEVDAALERALSDRDWQVRQAAEDLIGRSPT